jgi:hypothetical protein
MSATQVFENVADVLEKAAAYIEVLEAQVETADSTVAQQKQAQEQAELDELVAAVTSVSAVDAAELRQKLSAAPADVRDVIRSLVGQPTDTDIGNITEKRAGGAVSYKDDPDQAFLNWAMSP